MQKKEREIKNSEQLLEILRSGKYTTVSLCRNNEPYVVTLSYGFDEDKNTLYFHSAKGTADANVEPIVAAQEKLKKDGKIRFIGISTHRNEPEVLRAAIKMFLP